MAFANSHQLHRSAVLCTVACKFSPVHFTMCHDFLGLHLGLPLSLLPVVNNFSSPCLRMGCPKNTPQVESVHVRSSWRANRWFSSPSKISSIVNDSTSIRRYRCASGQPLSKSRFRIRRRKRRSEVPSVGGWCLCFCRGCPFSSRYYEQGCSSSYTHVYV